MGDHRPTPCRSIGRICWTVTKKEFLKANWRWRLSRCDRRVTAERQPTGRCESGFHHRSATRHYADRFSGQSSWRPTPLPSDDSMLETNDASQSHARFTAHVTAVVADTGPPTRRCLFVDPQSQRALHVIRTSSRDGRLRVLFPDLFTGPGVTAGVHAKVRSPSTMRALS